jgi:ribosome-interacting GTPase 1
MPTNVPPQYKEAEARFRAAATVEEKIAALEEMLSIMPKHKGTDKLQADIKTRLAKLRRQTGKKGARRGASHMIPKEGAGQVALVGPPNGGKSSLVAKATRAVPKVAEYPYSTQDAVPGMMPYQDVGLQLIDLPPVSQEHVEPWVFDLVRRADLLWLVVASGSALDGLEETRDLLLQKRIRVVPAGSPREEGGLDLEKEALLVVTGGDRPRSEDEVEALRDLLGDPWPVFLVSSLDGRGFEELARVTFEALDVMRVYTKEPGRPPDMEKPFTLERGATVGDLARAIHKDLSEQFKFAKVWGEAVFDGQRVKPDHVLHDGDVVEVHT